MPIDVYMTQLSPTMTEGKIVRWLKKEGDTLSSGEVLAEIETDKATMEMEVVDEGVLHKIIAPEGAVVTVGNPIAVIAEEGEEVPADYAPKDGAKPAQPAAEAEQPKPAAASAAAAPQPQAQPAPASTGPPSAASIWAWVRR